MTEIYRVIYRQGGPERCKWANVLDTFGSIEDAKIKAEEIERLGYATKTMTSREHAIAGLPIGWSFKHWREQYDTHHLNDHGWWCKA